MTITLTVILHEDKIDGIVKVVMPCGCCGVDSNDLMFALETAVRMIEADKAQKAADDAINKAATHPAPNTRQ
jgi:hypothetical protein